MKKIVIMAFAALLVFFGVPTGLVFLLATSVGNPGAGNAAGTSEIPSTALAAYAAASVGASALVPGCVVPASVLAGVGKVESNHAGGRSILGNGDVSPPVIGPALDGTIVNTQKIADTDGGRLDGDPVWDHAVGPMQILPSTWRTWGRDGNGDGVADPQNYFDATLSAALILCQPPADLTDPGNLSAALHAYNNSDEYVAAVMSWAGSYAAAQALPAVAPSMAERTQPLSSSRKAGSMLWLIGDSR